jgi:Bacterial HORMA domain family 1
MMTATGTRTATFTITDARYVGAKVGADLRLLNDLYGQPGLALVDDFVEEAALLLRDGYLGTVSYGFRDESADAWKLRLRYTAAKGGYLNNDRPGNLPVASAVTGYAFCSHLTYSASFGALAFTQQAAVRDALPIQRATGSEPVIGLGSNQCGHGYGRNGAGVNREVFMAIGMGAP